MKLPPKRPTPPVSAVPASTAQARSRPQSSNTTTSLLLMSASGAGPLFRAPQSRSSVRWRASPAHGKPPRGRSARGPAGLPGEVCANVEGEEVPGKINAVVSMTMDTSLGGGDGQGGEREGDQKERRLLRIARQRRVGAEAEDELDLAQLLSQIRAAASLDEMTGVLRLAMTQRRGGDVGMLVSIAKVWQASRPAESRPAATALAGVKQALTQAFAGATAADNVRTDDRRAIVNLWLPIYLLNLTRPRSAQQRQQASERLALIERGVARLATGTG